MELFLGCPQKVPDCDPSNSLQHLLLVANSLDNVLRIYHVEENTFFNAPNPLFPLSMSVGEYPTNLSIDPNGRYAFVVNALSGDISLVDLDPHVYAEVDADADACTSFCGSVCPKPEGVEYLDARCLAGVSRVALTPTGFPQPEDVVTIPGELGKPTWDPGVPLPVYVSLIGTGQLAKLSFQYPTDNGTKPVLKLEQLIDVEGSPSGLALTADGSRLFAADESKNSIIVLDTLAMTIERIEIGHPSRKLAISPDGSVLYIASQNDGQVSMLNLETLQLKMPGDARIEAVDPERSSQGFEFGGVVRSIGFVYGVEIKYFTFDLKTKVYTTELLTQAELDEKLKEDPDYKEEAVKTFAFISNLDGNFQIIDAINHRLVDAYPHLGAACPENSVKLLVDQKEVPKDTLKACLDEPGCKYPMLAEYDRFSGKDDEDRDIYNGIFVHTSQTRDEFWTLTWEGMLPKTKDTTTGKFEDLTLIDSRADLDFSSLGVQVGDLVEVTSEPVSDPAECKLNPKEFTIDSVEMNRLVLLANPGPGPEVCWPKNLKYQIRAAQSWVVIAARSGLMERPEMVPWQKDLPDSHPVYDNGLIKFTLFAPGQNPDTGQPYPIKRDTVWSFETSDGYTRLIYQPPVKYSLAGGLVSVDTTEGESEEEREDDFVFVLYQASNLLYRFDPNNLGGSNIAFIR